MTECGALLQTQVEELERQLEAARRMSAEGLPPGRVPPPPPLKQLPQPPPHGGSLKLQQKSGWLYKMGGIKGERGWISCCGLEMEADTGENAKSRFCFTVKALSGSTTRRIELACASSAERCEWVLSLQQLLEVYLPPALPKVLFARVMAQVRHHEGAPPHSIVSHSLGRTANCWLWCSARLPIRTDAAAGCAVSPPLYQALSQHHPLQKLPGGETASSAALVRLCKRRKITTALQRAGHGA